MERVLILGLALASADSQVLRRLHKEGCARDCSQLAAHFADELVGGYFSLLTLGLEGNEHSTLIFGSVSSCESDNGLDVAVPHYDAHELLHLFFHGSERNILVGLN